MCLLHTLIALSLLGELGQVDGVFVTHFVGLGSLKGVVDVSGNWGFNGKDAGWEIAKQKVG